VPAAAVMAATAMLAAATVLAATVLATATVLAAATVLATTEVPAADRGHAWQKQSPARPPSGDRAGPRSAVWVRERH
jgi:hypothetical protein